MHQADVAGGADCFDDAHRNAVDFVAVDHELLDAIAARPELSALNHGDAYGEPAPHVGGLAGIAVAAARPLRRVNSCEPSTNNVPPPRGATVAITEHAHRVVAIDGTARRKVEMPRLVRDLPRFRLRETDQRLTGRYRGFVHVPAPSS